MDRAFRFSTAVALPCTMLVILAASLAAQSQPAVPNLSRKEANMTSRAEGTFEVKLVPLTSESDPALGRMSIDKQLHGDLEGTTKGEMLSFMSSVKGSAGYVAMEKVTGTLKGKKGTFVLQHNATMTRGTPEMNITVVPDSGTDQLEGLTGKLKIIITEGKHSYEFDYAMPESQ